MEKLSTYFSIAAPDIWQTDAPPEALLVEIALQADLGASYFRRNASCLRRNASCFRRSAYHRDDILKTL